MKRVMRADLGDLVSTVATGGQTSLEKEDNGKVAGDAKKMKWADSTPVMWRQQRFCLLVWLPPPNQKEDS